MANPVQELRQRIHKEGYDTRKTTDGHWEVFAPDGNKVRFKSGMPVLIADTPRSENSLKKAVNDLRSVGVLPKPTTPQPRQPKFSTKQLTAKTHELRHDMKLLIELYELRQTDIYHYADYYAEQHGLPVPSGPEQMVSRVLSGKQNYLMNDPYRYLRAAVDAIKAADGDIPRAEELRARTANGNPQLEPEPKELEVVSENPTKVVRSPKLAIEVMRWIADPNKDWDVIESLVNEIAKLELK
jgi:hypothetical protein